MTIATTTKPEITFDYERREGATLRRFVHSARSAAECVRGEKTAGIYEAWTAHTRHGDVVWADTEHGGSGTITLPDHSWVSGDGDAFLRAAERLHAGESSGSIWESWD